MKMESSKLQELGLTKNESLVYKALLEQGPSQAGLISRKTGLPTILSSALYSADKVLFWNFLLDLQYNKHWLHAL